MLAEQRADADAGEVVAGLADARRAGSVVAVLRMIERQFHEPLEGDATAAAGDFAADFVDEFRVAGHAPTITQRVGAVKVKLRLQEAVKPR